MRSEVEHLQRQLALERERSDVLAEQLDNAEEDLRIATARLNSRSIIGKRQRQLDNVAASTGCCKLAFLLE